MKAYRVDRQGRGNDFELALVREGKVFAYLIPAERSNVDNRLGVLELAAPLEGLPELIKTAQDALAMLQCIQEKTDGAPIEMPWPEIDRLDLALKAMSV